LIARVAAGLIGRSGRRVWRRGCANRIAAGDHGLGHRAVVKLFLCAEQRVEQPGTNVVTDEQPDSAAE
jgi:hypothetical protein